MKISLLAEPDIPAVQSLEALCFPDPWSVKGLRDTIREDCACFFGAWDDAGTLCGYLNATWVLDEININRICTHPAFRRLGAAKHVVNGREVRSSIIASQVEEHRKYGGVVPEIASRRHCENICWVVDAAMKEAGMDFSDLDAIAVTYAPGLIGALLVGVNYAKGLAMAAEKPLIPTHHIRSHIAANYIAHPDLKPPFLCMVASGGHSHIIEVLDYTHFRIIGRTRDDAAGEAFDKAARAMGYPYPGGIAIFPG